jgi:protein-disulfide isomerase
VRILSYFLAAIAGAAVAAAVLIYLPAGRTQQGLSAGQTKAVEDLISAYLGKHPELVAKALDQLQEEQKTAAREATQTAIRDKASAIFRDPADQVLGNPQGDVTIVEFFDYRCPYCKRATPSLMQTLKDDGHVRLVLKEFPILGPNSVLAAQAAIASIKQDKYAAFHLALLATQSALDEGTIMSIAEATGIDTQRLSADMKDPAIDALVKKNYELARELKIDGTPAFIIGDELVPGVIDRPVLEELIKRARGKG